LPSGITSNHKRPATIFSPLQAVESLKSTVQSQGHNLERQGILIETLDGHLTLASENADVLFNPASVMKVATSLVALAKFGPDHRYRTEVLADGHIDRRARLLEGDLVIDGSADPMFALADAQEIAAQLAKVGVARVSGSLRVAGPFYYFATGYRSNLSRETSAEKLRNVLERAGIKIAGPVVFGPLSGEPLLAHYSDRLVQTLLYQNAHSSNAIAEVVGESIGGPDAIREFLVKEIGIQHKDIYVGRASGLEFNRITPRASLRVLRALINMLSSYSLTIEDVMPVAGVDAGTLRSRFDGEKMRGSIIAKTGTLITIDNGVSNLVGIAYTRAHGPLAFAIFNSDGGVHGYRQLQDQFLTQVIEEEGGGIPSAHLEDRLANNERQSFSVTLVKPTGP
jgi:D-alanyl-D-alanine carboxypeptidase/D-alanyl-D-alanine-endopeptidase (penicillin-binding protein 4)